LIQSLNRTQFITMILLCHQS